MKVNQNVVADFEKEFIETPMSVSDFNVNAKYEDIKAIVNFILNLLFMRPGTIPEHPEMGFNLRHRQHYLLNEKNVAIQNQDLQTQINTYVQSPLISEVSLSPIQNDQTGEIDTTVILIKFLTNQTISIYDDGLSTRIGVSQSNKNFNL